MWINDAGSNTRTIKALLETAEDRARELGDTMPGPEHLLLAALELEDGSARQALASYDVTPDAFREAIMRTHADALGGVDVAGAGGSTKRGLYRSTDTLRHAFQRAAKLSKRGKRFRGAYVVIAVAELEYGTSARVLAVLGVPREGLIEAAHRALSHQ